MESSPYILNKSGFVTISNDFNENNPNYKQHNAQQLLQQQQMAQQQHHQQHKLQETQKGHKDNGHGRSQSSSGHNFGGSNKYLNKFSQWLPDMKKMSKRHRSHSLPAGVENDDDLQSGNIDSPYELRSPPVVNAEPVQKPQHSTTGSKKKKRNIVSTMSNIMQKAKIYRRHSFSHSNLTNSYQQSSSSPTATPVKMVDNGRKVHHQSLRGTSSSRYVARPMAAHSSHSTSDPENDLYGGFFSDNDERSGSEIYDKSSADEQPRSQHSRNMFPVVDTASSANALSSSNVEGEKGLQQFQKHYDPRNFGGSANSNEHLSQGQGHVQQGQAVPPDHSNGNAKFQMMGDMKNGTPRESSNGQNRGSSGGESAGSDEINQSSESTAGTTEKVTPNEPSNANDVNNKFIFSSTSMEFAVSRKIAKYRQKNVSSDDINGQKLGDVGSQSFGEEDNNNAKSSNENKNSSNSFPHDAKGDAWTHQKPIAHHLQKTHSIFVEDDLFGVQECNNQNELSLNKVSPGMSSLPGHAQSARGVPAAQSYTQQQRSLSGMQQQQQSLDIPTSLSRDDEDSKSQHSYRTISSSRRQSTEDSIDTDDEYFCYELRKLEELERISHMEKAGMSASMAESMANNEQTLLSKIDSLANVDGPISRYDEEDEGDMMIMYYNSEADAYQPDEDVREKMTIVLEELKSVVLSRPDAVQKAVATNKQQQKSNMKKRGNAYEKFARVTDMSWQQPQQPQPVSSYRKPTGADNEYYNDDDDGNDFMREINQFEFEINNERQRKQSHPFEKIDPHPKTVVNKEQFVTKKVVRKKRRKRSAGNVHKIGDTYDSDENQYSSTPYSSADEDPKIRDKSHSSGATSGPDSPCHFTDDDLDGHATTLRGIAGIEDYSDFKQRQTQKQTLDETENQNFVKSTIIADENVFEMNANDEENDLNDSLIRNSGDGGIMSEENIFDENFFDNPDENESIDIIDENGTHVSITKKNMLSKMLSHESSQDSTNGVLGSSKWKLLKTLKEKKIEEKNNQEKIKEEEIANKEKESVSTKNRRMNFTKNNQIKIKEDFSFVRL